MRPLRRPNPGPQIRQPDDSGGLGTESHRESQKVTTKKDFASKTRGMSDKEFKPGFQREDTVSDRLETVGNSDGEVSAAGRLSDSPAPNAGLRPAGDQSVMAQIRQLLGFEPNVQLRNLTAESALSISEAKEEGKYVIERKIGEGGMGQGFLAFDRDLRRSIAIKVITMVL